MPPYLTTRWGQRVTRRIDRRRKLSPKENRASCILRSFGFLFGLPIYVSINDIREEAKDGWHKTYTVNGEPISVDVDIEIPDVDAIPAIRVRLPGNLDQIWPPYASYNTTNDTGFSYMVQKEAKLTDTVGGSDEWFEPGDRAVNSPFPPNEATAFFVKRIQPFKDRLSMGELKLTRVFATSRVYAASDVSARGVTPNYDKPINDNAKRNGI